MENTQYFVWDISPILIDLGVVQIRWYGLLFAMSFLAGYYLMKNYFLKDNFTEKQLEKLSYYMVIGTIAGARLGHCLFYAPDYYLANPIDILKVWEGGLASHGAAIGILVAIKLFIMKNKDFNYLWLLDRLVVPISLAAFFQRMGNLFNSEILGIGTDVPWAVVFSRIDDMPRHPAQLYEAICYLAIFIFLFTKSKSNEIKSGNNLGLFMILVFSLRFFIEFIKENQSSFESTMLLNMGQILSIPLVLTGIFLLFRKK